VPCPHLIRFLTHRTYRICAPDRGGNTLTFVKNLETKPISCPQPPDQNRRSDGRILAELSSEVEQHLFRIKTASISTIGKIGCKVHVDMMARQNLIDAAPGRLPTISPTS